MPTLAPNDFKFNSVGRPKRYEWEQYADGRVWMFQRGDDFPNTTSVRSFRTQAYAFAAKNGYATKTAVSGNVVFVQFNKKEK